MPAAAVNARLVQSGAITADGGAVQLVAAATDAALRTVMQVDGVIRARSIENRGGQITLSGGSSGMVLVGGQLDASGVKGAGGTIEVLGDRVGLVGTAHLDASGATGGGTVLVGGNRHGEGTEQNATNTYVGSGAVIDASATGKGDGGKVVVWADGTTTYTGQINARWRCRRRQRRPGRGVGQGHVELRRWRRSAGAEGSRRAICCSIRCSIDHRDRWRTSMARRATISRGRTLLVERTIRRVNSQITASDCRRVCWPPAT